VPGGRIERRVPPPAGDLPRDGRLPVPVEHMQIVIQRETCGVHSPGEALQACIRMDGNMAVAGCDVPPVAVRLATLKRGGEQKHAMRREKGQRILEQQNRIGCVFGDLECGYQIERSFRPRAIGKERIVALASFKSAQLQFLDQFSFAAAIIQNFDVGRSGGQQGAELLRNVFGPDRGKFGICQNIFGIVDAFGEGFLRPSVKVSREDEAAGRAAVIGDVDAGSGENRPLLILTGAGEIVPCEERCLAAAAFAGWFQKFHTDSSVC